MLSWIVETKTVWEHLKETAKPILQQASAKDRTDEDTEEEVSAAPHRKKNGGSRQAQEGSPR